jgi:putative membrane protein
VAEETIILTAEFNPKTKVYWLISGTLILSITFFGILFLPIWIPLGLIFTGRYLARMECILTDKTLKVGKGLLTRVEKTIPLEKITDLGMVQGPIMRALDLRKLTVETAGQSSGPGSLVALTGIVDAEGFREAVLRQRDILAASGPGASLSQPAADPSQPSQVELLTEIRDSLRRIEGQMSSG